MSDKYPHVRKCYHATDLNSYEKEGELLHPTDDKPANVVSSLCIDGLHRPALDIDIPCVMFESATPGHCHLYFPTVALTWERYLKLLLALEECGIIEPKFRYFAARREQTILRLPGAKKRTEKASD